MAEKRMFSVSVVDSDAFLALPLSSQSLYFHLAMRADDDGFIDNPVKIMRIVGANQGDMEQLLQKRYLLYFESGVMVVKHWKLHNYLRKDRYKPTLYQEEFAKLETRENGVYTEVKKRLNTSASDLGIPVVDQLATQSSIEKSSIDKNRIEKSSKEVSDEINNSIPMIEMPISGGGRYSLDSDFYRKLCSAYPELSIDVELQRMNVWLEANPSKLKTMKGMPKFINSWLSRTNEKITLQNQSTFVKEETRMPEYTKPIDEDEDTSDYLEKMQEFLQGGKNDK